VSGNGDDFLDHSDDPGHAAATFEWSVGRRDHLNIMGRHEHADAHDGETCPHSRGDQIRVLGGQPQASPKSPQSPNQETKEKPPKRRIGGGNTRFGNALLPFDACK
jgi:hypothetical protein